MKKLIVICIAVLLTGVLTAFQYFEKQVSATEASDES
ncbi:MAG: hypothetical protein K0Q85_1660, partial [Caproiciproducens sp.]|nr:hypothetical protein [Caproiciproducens sp.]